MSDDPTPEPPQRVPETDITPDQIRAWEQQVEESGPEMLALLKRKRPGAPAAAPPPA